MEWDRYKRKLEAQGSVLSKQLGTRSLRAKEEAMPCPPLLQPGWV